MILNIFITIKLAEHHESQSEVDQNVDDDCLYNTQPSIENNLNEIHSDNVSLSPLSFAQHIMEPENREENNSFAVACKFKRWFLYLWHFNRNKYTSYRE